MAKRSGHLRGKNDPADTWEPAAKPVAPVKPKPKAKPVAAPAAPAKPVAPAPPPAEPAKEGE